MKMLRLAVFTSLLLGSSALAEPSPDVAPAAHTERQTEASLLIADLTRTVDCDKNPDCLCKLGLAHVVLGHLKTACLLHRQAARQAVALWCRAKPKDMTRAAWLDACRALREMKADLEIIDCSKLSDLETTGEESRPLPASTGPL